MESLSIAIALVVIAFATRDTVLRLFELRAEYRELLDASRRRSAELDGVMRDMAEFARWRTSAEPALDEHARYIEAARLRESVDRGQRR